MGEYNSRDILARSEGIEPYQEIEQPEFDNERELIIMVQDGVVYKDAVRDGPKACVLILSYNRPRMLGEAIESVLSQRYRNMDVFVVDDGSDFDVWGLIESFRDERLLLAAAPKITIEERMAVSRVGANINAVLSQISSDSVVYYLCDDDIMAPDWIPRSMTGFINYDAHVVAGEPWYFNDGEDWSTSAKYGMPRREVSGGIPTAYWATGSFAHLARCFHSEGLRWKDNTYLHSQDTNFINDLWDLHSDYLYIKVPAVYRREHPNMLSAKLGRKEDGLYKPGFVPPPAKREHIEGLME